MRANPFKTTRALSKARILVSVDPGKHTGGAAWFQNGRLIHVALIKVPKTANESEYARAFARLVYDEVSSKYPFAGMTVDLICEDQVVDSRTPNANDLLDCANTVGAVEAYLWYAAVERVVPNDWRGSLKGKDIIENRISALLLDDEASIVASLMQTITVEKNRSHPWDAIGIGLWHLGRAERGMVHVKGWKR